MTKFERRFYKSLNEQAEEERAAFEAELEDNTEAGDFDVDVEVDEVSVEEDPNVKAAQAVSERNAAMRTELESWVGEIEQFLEYLNGSSPDSIQTLLANAEPDTDLAALNESFKGYIAQTGNAQFKYV